MNYWIIKHNNKYQRILSIKNSNVKLLHKLIIYDNIHTWQKLKQWKILAILLKMMNAKGERYPKNKVILTWMCGDVINKLNWTYTCLDHIFINIVELHYRPNNIIKIILDTVVSDHFSTIAKVVFHLKITDSN